MADTPKTPLPPGIPTVVPYPPTGPVGLPRPVTAETPISEEKAALASTAPPPPAPVAEPSLADVPAWLQELFNRAGLGSLATWYLQRVREGATDAQIAVEIYDQQAYRDRFPAMAALRSKGQAISEAEYVSMEKSYAQALDAYGLRGSAFDRKDTYTRLIESGVDTQTLEERLHSAKMVADATDPNIRNALMANYGIGVADLTQYALDPAGIGKDHVERLARSATLQGLARTFSLSMDRAYSEKLAADTAFDNSTEADFRSSLATVSDLASSQRRLAQVEGGRFTDEDAADVVVKKDSTKTLASRQRAAREAARFSGRAGVTASTLRDTSL